MTKAIGKISQALNGKKPPVTHIAFILDKSGSMLEVKEPTRQFFNEQVGQIKQDFADLPTTVSLVEFNGNVDEKFFATELAKLKPMEPADYDPIGGTALNDGIGYTIDKLKKLPDADFPTTAFLVVIITDGDENASRNYQKSDVAETIKGLDATDRWTFSFMGANQNVDEVIKDYNIGKGNSLSYSSNTRGIQVASLANSGALNAYSKSRKAGFTSKADFYTDPTITESKDKKK